MTDESKKLAKVIHITDAKIKKLVWCPRCYWGGLLEEEEGGGYWCNKCMYRWAGEDDS